MLIRQKKNVRLKLQKEVKCKKFSMNRKQSCLPFGKAKCQKHDFRKWGKDSHWRASKA